MVVMPLQTATLPNNDHKAQAIFDIPHGRRGCRVDCRVMFQRTGADSLRLGSNAIVVSPLFASDYLSPNLAGLIREHPQFLSSPFVCSLITSAKHKA